MADDINGGGTDGAGKASVPSGATRPPLATSPAPPLAPAPSPPSAPETSTESEPAAGSLAAALRDSSRHPVLLFGTSTSGKSTLLISLFHCLKRDPRVNITLGPAIVDVNTEEGRRIHAESLHLFERRVEAFDNGEIESSTQFNSPIFISVDLKPTDGLGTAKFAFMEVSGEVFDPSQNDNGSIFKELHKEIIGVLRSYRRPITIIYLAPCWREGERKAANPIDIGLEGAIQSYDKERGSKSQDFHLFLFNKWDQIASPEDDDHSFSRVRSNQVATFIGKQYGRAWPAYTAIRLPVDHVRRYYMQYAAAFILDGQVIREDRYEKTFVRYRKTVWNWLYGNATEEKVGDTIIRQSLFPEVGSRESRRISIIERITNLVLSR